MEGDVCPRQRRVRVEADPSLRRGRVQHRWGVDHHVSRRGVTEALRVGDGHPRGERPRLRVGVLDRLAGGVRGRPAVAEVPDVGQVARRLRVGTAGGRERDLVADRGRGRVGGRLRLRRGVHRSPAAATATATAGVLGVVGVARAARIGREVDERVTVVVDPVIALRRRRRRVRRLGGVGVARAARVGREVDERVTVVVDPVIALRRRRRRVRRLGGVGVARAARVGREVDERVTVVVDPVIALRRRRRRVRRLGGVGVARAARVGREVDERVTVVVDPVIALRRGGGGFGDSVVSVSLVQPGSAGKSMNVSPSLSTPSSHCAAAAAGSATRWCRCRSCSPGRPGSR